MKPSRCRGALVAGAAMALATAAVGILGASSPAPQADERRRIEAVADAARDLEAALAEERHATERRHLEAVAVRDPSTGLLWTRRDSGTDLLWPEAVAYCEHLRVDGLTTWVLPTIEQLEALYDAAAPADDCESMNATVGRWMCHHRLEVDLSAPWIWSRSEDGEDRAWHFFFRSGARKSLLRFGDATARALCVTAREGA